MDYKVLEVEGRASCVLEIYNKVTCLNYNNLQLTHPYLMYVTIYSLTNIYIYAI
jgi:hypothetical protein